MARDGNDVELRAMLELVDVKGWDSVEFTGANDFKRRAMTMALRQWLVVHAEGRDRVLLDAVVGEFDDVRRQSAVPAKTTIGNRTTGVIEAVDARFVYQRTADGALVSPERAAFVDDRVGQLERAIRSREPQDRL